MNTLLVFRIFGFFVLNGGTLKSLYELCFPKSYIIDFIKLKDQSLKLNPDFLKRDFYEKGLSLRKMATKYNCSRSTLAKSIKGSEKINLHQHRKKKIHIDTLKRITVMRSEGLSYEQIAKRLNLLGVKTRTDTNRWYEKAVREVFIASSNNSCL